MSNKGKVALITGVTGQDGSYLVEFLLTKGYVVHGIKRRSSSFNTQRIDHLYQDPHEDNQKFILHYGDLTDSVNLISIIEKVQPDEIYNLGAQSHVAVSFETPEYTANCDALGTLRILEAVRILGMKNKTRIYQASTSELFGKVQEIPQNENTPFYPRSPYGVAKMYAYWITVNYRESYGIYACNGILFNHESPRRGETFVTKKITRGLSRIHCGLDNCLYLGNIEAKRDWGHAKDYVEMQWLMLQQEKPEDFVISTGRQKSIRDFVELVARKLKWNVKDNSSGVIWEGNGINEIGRREDTNQIVILSTTIKKAKVRTPINNRSNKIDKSWSPSEDAIEVLQRAGVNAEFINSLLDEFIIYWSEKSSALVSYNSKFIEYCRLKWAQHTAEIDTKK